MKKQLHPGAKWSWRIGFYFFGILITLSLLIFSISAKQSWAFYLFLTIILIVILIAEIYTRLAYANWFYEFAENQLRLERGIIWKRYSNIPYERIQNVDITRGIIARILGFSTVMIQTAGFSHTPNQNFLAEGYIPAVSASEAEHIREFLMKKISKRGREQGL